MAKPVYEQQIRQLPGEPPGPQPGPTYSPTRPPKRKLTKVAPIQKSLMSGGR